MAPAAVNGFQVRFRTVAEPLVDEGSVAVHVIGVAGPLQSSDAGERRPCGCPGNGPAGRGPAIWREAGWDGYRCRCGLVYVDPPPPPRPLAPDLHHDGFYAIPVAQRLDWVARFCPAGRLLEVGPGPGHLLAAARARGYTVAGVDPSPASARRLRALGIEVEQATIEDSRLPDGAFDAVFHVDLLSHFEDPVAALRAMARRLGPGGTLCFELSLLGGISPAWYRAQGRVGFPEHRWLYSREALERVIGRAGLDLVGLERFGLAPVVGLILARRVAGPLALRLAGRGASGNGAAREGLPPVQNAPHRLYERALSFLRYRVGRRLAGIGPEGVLVAARKSEERRS